MLPQRDSWRASVHRVGVLHGFSHTFFGLIDTCRGLLRKVDGSGEMKSSREQLKRTQVSSNPTAEPLMGST